MEAASFEAVAERGSASVVPAEPVPWHHHQRTTGPRARHSRVQDPGRLSFSFILPGAQVVDTIWLKPVHVNLHAQLGAQMLWLLYGHSRGPHAL